MTQGGGGIRKPLKQRGRRTHHLGSPCSQIQALKEGIACTGGKGWHRAGWEWDMDMVGHRGGDLHKQVVKSPVPSFLLEIRFPQLRKSQILGLPLLPWTSSTSWLPRHCEFKQDDKLGVFWCCVMATVKSLRGFRVSLPAASWGMASGSPLRPATVGGC